jgi:hypothetical protein
LDGERARYDDAETAAVSKLGGRQAAAYIEELGPLLARQHVQHGQEKGMDQGDD